MDKFCGQCGSPLNENGVCPNCTVQQESGYEQTQVKNIQPVTKKKSTKKAGIIVAIILAFVVVIGAVAGTVGLLFGSEIFGNSKNINTHSCVIEYKNRLYYAGTKQLMDITDDANPHVVGENKNQLLYVPAFSCYDGKYVYVADRYNSEFYKYKISGDKTTKEAWVDRDRLTDVFNRELGNNTRNVAQILDLCICDDYVFFWYSPTGDYWAEDKANAFTIGKISLDGKNIEFFDDIHASSMICDGKWLYYYDNGFIYGEEEVDVTKAGLYRMKAEGTDRELLVSICEEDVSGSSTYNSRFKVYSQLRIFGKYLYFIDNSAEGESRVCRIKLDGSDKKYVSDDGAYKFTIDEKNDTLYYIAGNNLYVSEEAPVYELSMDLKSKKEICSMSCTDSSELSVYDGYLYISNPDRYSIIEGTAGRRYNIKTGEMEELIADADTPEIVLNPATGGFELQGDTVYHFSWKKE